MNEAVQRIIDDLADMPPLPGQNLVIHAPCATASAVAPVQGGRVPDELEEAGDGLD